MAGQTDMELIKDGVRLDGRKPDELREVKITAGVLDNADGSCYLEWGNNKIYAGVFGPMECHPRHKQKADRAIVQAIIALSKSLQLEVTAEGVETQRQLELLKQYGCATAQGYFFTKPNTAEVLQTLYALQSPRNDLNNILVG